MGRVLKFLTLLVLLSMTRNAMAVGPSCPSGSVLAGWINGPAPDSRKYHTCGAGARVADELSCMNGTSATWTSEFPYSAQATADSAAVYTTSCVGNSTGTGSSCVVSRHYIIQYTVLPGHPGFTDHTQGTTQTTSGSPICLPPPDCSSYTGRKGYFSNSVVASGCNTSNRCAVTIDTNGPKLAGSFDSTGLPVYWTGSYSGSACASPVPEVSETADQPLPDGGTGGCDGASSATSACISAQKQNCGYVNGEYRCVTASQLTDDNPCVQTASGGVFCKADAPTQPLAPTNADGTKKSPDAQFKLTPPGASTQTTVNYYSNSTVQSGSDNPGSDEGGDEAGKGDCGSKKTPCHVVVDTGGTADGTGTGGGGGDGDGYGEGDGDCTGDNCGAGLPAFGGVNDFSKSVADFVQVVHQSEVASMATKLAGAIPTPGVGDVAPEASFSVFNQSYTMKVPDQLWDAVLPLAALLFKVMWCFVGVRLFLS